MSETEGRHLLDGTTIRYAYDGGWSFRVRFYNGLAAYEFLDDEAADVSNENTDIPYQARQLTPMVYHTMWHETDIGDVVTLVLDFNQMRVHSAALVGYRGDGTVHFESGTIEEVSGLES